MATFLCIASNGIFQVSEFHSVVHLLLQQMPATSQGVRIAISEDEHSSPDENDEFYAELNPSDPQGGNVLKNNRILSRMLINDTEVSFRTSREERLKKMHRINRSCFKAEMKK